MFSYPFYLRMKQYTPEFAELAAFQAGGSAVQRAAGRKRPHREAYPRRIHYRQLLLYVRD